MPVYRKAIVATALSLETRAFIEVMHQNQNQNQILMTLSDGTVVHRYQINGYHTWQVYVLEVGSGNVQAAAKCQSALRELRADIIIFMGIAGRIKSGVEKGDVVIAERIAFYETGKDTADGTLPRGDRLLSSNRLCSMARALVIQTSWADKFLLQQPLKAVIGVVASGEKVLTSQRSEVYKHLRNHYSDVIAVEMEGYGTAVAAQLNSVDWIVVRAISDYLDDKSADNDTFQPTAAKQAAAFVTELISRLAYVDKPEAADPVIRILDILEENNTSIGQILDQRPECLRLMLPIVDAKCIDELLSEVSPSVLRGENGRSYIMNGVGLSGHVSSRKPEPHTNYTLIFGAGFANTYK